MAQSDSEWGPCRDCKWWQIEPDAVIADPDSGIYVDPDRIRAVSHRGAQFDVRGVATLPAGPLKLPATRCDTT